MNVLVIGAHGQIGNIVVEKLQENESATVVAGLRKDEQIKDYEDRGIKTAKIDLSKDIKHIADAMKNIDAVVFSAGSGGKTGADKTMMIDLDGAVKAVEAAKEAKVDHFVMVSAVNADDREFWSYADAGDEIGSYYYAAKYYADQWLINSGVNYTIIRPTRLLNESGTGKIIIADRMADEDTSGEIAREDVAETIVQALKHANAKNKAFELSAGDQSITDAVKAL